ncbi:glycoside hydrolase family 127 protein [Parahaliea maris]|uniref:Glycoside hydrolase family 127 protein n=1 Tax=Parahaliea maris TaxID=2716870 RepID=A0A5C8ZP13_9GAMM|nr:glycoside hydrolase family 127 protein [Parahaliea maris]TXS90228.1 glycoside hydrolase family 127 protein [Parahaliea maris]
MPLNTPRRQFVKGLGATAALATVPRGVHAVTGGALPARARPLPLAAVRLLPGPMLDAVLTNTEYLHRLEPDRLLHNFYTGAGLPPKGEVYGGWEGDTIAGHTLGHYLSALSLTHAQTGDSESCRRVQYIVDELQRIQAQRGDGYVAGLTRKRPDGTIADGQEIFPEIMRGEIISGGFDLNGAWAPLYTIHKLFAGLLDAQHYCGVSNALPVALGFASYLEKVFLALSDEQLQQVLACEYGGLNESFAEFYARTGDARWLAVARRLYDQRVLDPLMAGRDELANFHANTQVPKLVGLARIAELDGDRERAGAARFFWQRVTGHHSYVIGGNADREYFFEPDRIADHITEQTCEHCNSYNMLRLTRRLYGQRPDAALFDYYERTHLNHIMAAQHPETGMFTYMTPLMAGSAREYSTPFDSFWCCVGSGMESHAKHGESIFWEGEGGGDPVLFVNQYIPAQAGWAATGARLRLQTTYPHGADSTLEVLTPGSDGAFTLALRIPGWAEGFTVKLNGEPVAPLLEAGYALVTRRWNAGDRLALHLTLSLREEVTPGDASTVALLHGPLVMAADLGPASDVYEGMVPALVGEAPLEKAVQGDSGTAAYRISAEVARPGALSLVPFYSQYERRSAVYFRRFSESQWTEEEAALVAAQRAERELAARSVAVIHLGEMQPERDCNLTSEISYPVVYRGRHGRDARMQGFFEFDLPVVPGELILQATYWGGERRRKFRILLDGEELARQELEAPQPGEFMTVSYPVPEPFTRNRQQVRVRFEPIGRHTAGPVFGIRLLRPSVAGASS